MSKKSFSLMNILLIFFLVGCNTPNSQPVVKDSSGPEPTVITEASPFPSPPAVEGGAELTRLNLAYGNLPTTLDPHRTSDQFTAEVLRLVCQGLIDFGRSSLLATGWDFAPDNKSVTFMLKEGVEFQDGTPFNAEAVRYSFERVQQPESRESPLYELFQGVQIETPNNYTVVFKFDEPRIDFLEVLESQYAVIISPLSNETEIAKNPICTGPYYVKSWEFDDFILLAKNENHTSAPDYFDNQGPAYIDEIKIQLIETHEERIQALLDGTLDTNHINTKEELASIKERSEDFELRRLGWLGGVTYLGFNYAASPTNELAVRQALAHAVNKRALIDAVLADDFAIPVASYLSPQTLGYTDELEDVKFDLDRSQQLLAKAGFQDNDGDGILERDGEPVQLNLLTTTDNIYLDMAAEIQKTLAKIGVAVDIHQATRPEISEITPTGDFDLLLYDYNWPYPSALTLFLSSDRIGGSNRVAYDNPSVDELLAEIAVLEETPGNEDVLRQKVIEAQQKIIKDVPWQPVLARRLVSAVNKRVVGEKTHESGVILWHDAKIIE